MSKGEEVIKVPGPKKDRARGPRKLAEERKLRRAARREAWREKEQLRKNDEPLLGDRRKGPKHTLRTFTLITAKNPGTLVARARRAAIENGSHFRGNKTSGCFSASGVKGVYKMVCKVVTVAITEKPFYVPWALAESELKRLLA